MTTPVRPGPPTCRRCQATLRFIRLANGSLMPVNPVPDRTGNVAARKVGSRYAAGYVLRKGEEPKPGFVVFRPHFADCPPDEAKHTRGEANPLF